jgi:trans-2,3-dihydro-3-hydroxyanthranilate isomerase
MQRIANEFSLPETVFVVQPSVPECQARLRIFTPERELPMAGHPTIGATFSLAAAGKLSSLADSTFLQLEIGPTLVELTWRENVLHTAWMSQRAPEFGPHCDDVAGLARMLRIPTSDIVVRSQPGQILSSGVPLLFVALRSRDAVDTAILDRAELANLCNHMGVGECPVYIFTLEKGTDDTTIYSRMFAPIFGIAEDPATGGANGPLGAYVAKHWPEWVPTNGQMVNAQGVKMGRPSRILVAVPNADRQSQGVKVGGQSVQLGQGELNLVVNVDERAT